MNDFKNADKTVISWGLKKGVKMTKILYYKEYYSPVFWGYKPEHKVKSYIKFQIHFNLKDGLWFSATVPNFTCGDRNPFKSIMTILEHESIGMSKYNKLKEDIRHDGRDKNLHCGTIKFD